MRFKYDSYHILLFFVCIVSQIRKNVMELDGYNKANTEILINADCMEESAFHDYPEKQASYDDHLQ